MTTRRRKRWHSQLVNELWEKFGGKDPIEAVMKRAHRLISDAGMTNPPFDPERLARLQGVREIRKVRMTADGRLVPQGDGFVIELRADHPEPRQHFSCAHEIGHTFFFECNPGTPRERSDGNIGNYSIDEEEEYLCDKAAAELLMPMPVFRRLAFRWGSQRYGLSLDLLFCLAREFQVSLSAAAIRLAETNLWKSMLVVLDPVELGSRPPEMQVAWAARSASVRSFLPRHLHLDPASNILSTLQTGDRSHGRERLSLGGDPENYYVESVRIGGQGRWRVLSLVVLEREPETFARPSRLPTNDLQWPLF